MGCLEVFISMLPMSSGSPCLVAQLSGTLECRARAFACGLRVDPSADVEPRTIRIYDTGQEITHFRGSYLGTFLMRGGALVFHAYEVTQAELD